MRTHTKLVCTIGPASSSPTKLKALIAAGMRVARLNFSHATHTDHARLIQSIRTAARLAGESVAILADLQGPKIRIGELDQPLSVVSGVEVCFGARASKDVIPVTYANLYKDVQKGHRILIEDGLIEAVVTRVSEKRVHARIKNGGTIATHKGMNFPDSTLGVSAITKKDEEDLRFALSKQVDWVALSFVKSPADIKRLRLLIKKGLPKGYTPPRVMAKIEKHEAVACFEELLRHLDGVMIARGDLGVEVAAQEVPILQKRFIEWCRVAGVPVIVATQMLDSMIRNPRATRAEVSDVANAVFDHADAVMLSGESATGKYPVEAAKMMMKIVAQAEASTYDDIDPRIDVDQPLSASISHTLKILARSGEIQGVLSSPELAAWSETLLLARPELPLFLSSSDKTQMRQLALRWGVIPFYLRVGKSQTFARRAIAQLKKQRLVKRGMRLAVVLGGEHGDGFDTVVVD